jgi:NMT1-like family
VFKSIGVPVITDYEIWKNNPEKVFGLRADFIEKYPNTVLALTKALIRAAIWLDADGTANRAEAAEILARPHVFRSCLVSGDHTACPTATGLSLGSGAAGRQPGSKNIATREQENMISRVMSSSGRRARSPPPSPARGPPHARREARKHVLRCLR